jgi:hypothetical protein
VTRQCLRTLCRVLIGVLLLAQLAVSAHACPRLSAAAQRHMPMAAVAATPHCDGMAGPRDADLANLCAAHCQQGQQSDQAATLAVPAALLNALYVIALAPEPAAAPRPAVDAANARAAASPPHAILHCCFRI